ncbi:MAG: hypothetical protein H6909_05185, partial [Rickettsiaceae bacterium]|nr:hypothetical protein [Rickettsiaceae bacterium]
MKPYRAKKKNNPELTLQKEQKLYQLYEKDHIGAFDAYKSCKNVVVFGEPHRGKSTVINSLLGHELKSIPDSEWNDEFLIDLVNRDREPQLEISYNLHYSPKHTELTPTQAEDITIWECPTLCKNIDDKLQMDEFPIIMQLLKTLDSVKFIYVAEYNDIFEGCRGQNFSFAVDVVARIFSNIDIIKKSILLVVTKAPPGSNKKFIADRINELAHAHEIPKNTQKMMKYFNESSIYVFSTPEKENEELEGPKLAHIAGLSFCDVSGSIQYPRLSPLNQELALNMLQELQEEEAQQQLEQAGIDTENISNAGFFIKIVDFLYDTLSGISILSKASHYAGEILMAFGSLIGI